MRGDRSLTPQEQDKLKLAFFSLLQNSSGGAFSAFQRKLICECWDLVRGPQDPPLRFDTGIARQHGRLILPAGMALRA